MQINEDFAMDLVAGYRPIRLLGEGKRAQVWLGRMENHDGFASEGIEGETTEEEDSFGQRQLLDSMPQLVALKRYRTVVTKTEIGRELECLSRVASRHVVRPIDFSSNSKNQSVLVLERLPSLTLSDLLCSRSLRPGEAVTVLAPILQAVLELHRAGVVHNAISPRVVHFDSEGAPVIVGFGSASIIEPTIGDENEIVSSARLSTDAGVLSELEQVLALCAVVLGPSRKSLAGILEPRRFDDPQAWLKLLSATIFDLAVAEPVDLKPSPRFTTKALPNRLVGDLSHSSSAGGEEEASESLSDSKGNFKARLRPRFQFLAKPLGNRKLDSTLQWLKRHKVRPKYFAIGVVAVIIMISSFTLTVGGQKEPAKAEVKTPPQSDQAAFVITAGELNLVQSDDPLVATKTLLQIRARCLESRSLECLAQIEQDKSAILDADQYRLTQELDSESKGVAIDPDVSQVELLQQIGGSALLSWGNPASRTILLVRNGTTWQLRDIISEDPGR